MSDDDLVAIPETLLIQLASGRVEELPLDDYVEGVVPTYLGLPAPFEALKAMAIAVRSEAVASRRHSRDGFDLCVLDHCQLWKPTNRYPDSDRAVEETAGQVMTASGRIVAGPHFDHCDGRTRDGEQALAGALNHCRSVPCKCGYTKVHGHGVGMCQRGAIAMARQGASAEEILKHYYTGIELSPARQIPRSELRQSLMLGRVVDAEGRPSPGLRLALTGASGTFHKATDGEGRFWFGGLPAGQWELKVKGEAAQWAGLRTDGRNTLEIKVAKLDAQRLVFDTVPLAHPRLLIGSLGYDGIPVTIIDSAGNEQTIISGSAHEFNPGGFSVTLPPPGACTLRISGQSFELEIGNIGLWLRFSLQPKPASA